jgi:hypothetical protein
VARIAERHEICFFQNLLIILQLQRSSAMILRSARSAIRAETLKTHNKLASWLFMLCTLLMLASVIRMWSHWFEISASLGISRAAGLLAVITGAALIVSWWVNTGNE